MNKINKMNNVAINLQRHVNEPESAYIIEFHRNVRVYAHKPNLDKKIDN